MPDGQQQPHSSDIKVLFRAGSMGKVMWMFDHVGLIEAHHADKTLDIEVAALEAEAENVEPMEVEDEEAAGTHWRAVFYADNNAGCGDEGAESGGMAGDDLGDELPAEGVPGADGGAARGGDELLQTLDAHDDVHRVYAALK
jgi:transcriptional/translational regulatory protein YebC/TACO1